MLAVYLVSCSRALTRWRPGSRPALSLALGSMLGSLFGSPALAQPGATAALVAPPAAQAVLVQSNLATGAILQAIISYTRWPRGVNSLGLCISRSASDAQEIARQVQPLHDGRQLDVHLIEANQSPLPPHCQAVYLEGWQPEPLRQLLRSLASLPVLTLGSGPEFCTDGGMFCLEALDGRTRFEVNLDAVARSGLRVHPQVLRMAKPQGRRA